MQRMLANLLRLILMYDVTACFSERLSAVAGVQLVERLLDGRGQVPTRGQ